MNHDPQNINPTRIKPAQKIKLSNDLLIGLISSSFWQYSIGCLRKNFGTVYVHMHIYIYLKL